MGHSGTAMLEDALSVEMALTPGSRSTVLLLGLHLYRAGGRVSECNREGAYCYKKINL